jgi:hypothetical protein
MAADERTMANWGVAAAAGAIGVAVLVAMQGAPPAGPPASPAAINAPADSGAPDDRANVPNPVDPNPVAPNAGAKDQTPSPAPQASAKPGSGAAPAKAASVEIAADSIGEAINPNLEFIVRFEGSGALARAQAMFAAGDRAGAEAAAKQAVAAAPNLRGLCFSKFTLGAETVLAHCQRLGGAQVKATSDRWTRRLRAMPDVDYADPNVILKNENPVRAPQ